MIPTKQVYSAKALTRSDLHVHVSTYLTQCYLVLHFNIFFQCGIENVVTLTWINLLHHYSCVSATYIIYYIKGALKIKTKLQIFTETTYN